MVNVIKIYINARMSFHIISALKPALLDITCTKKELF